MLCRQESDLQAILFELLIPACFHHLHLGKPTFNQTTRTDAAEELHLGIVFVKHLDAFSAEVIEMIVTNQQIIEIGKDIGIGRKGTFATHKGDVCKHWVKHDALAGQLHKEGVVAKIGRAHV